MTDPTSEVVEGAREIAAAYTDALRLMPSSLTVEDGAALAGHIARFAESVAADARESAAYWRAAYDVMADDLRTAQARTREVEALMATTTVASLATTTTTTGDISRAGEMR
jgi:hypothetical protein